MTPEQRIEAFRQFVARSPDDAFARYSLAMALRTAGQVVDAVAEFRELVSRRPEYVPTYLMLGQALETLGKDDEAARSYEAGITAASRNQDAHARGELEQALEAVRARGT